MKFERVDQVVSWRLCVGCGACLYVCPTQNITLVDVLDDGIRPFLMTSECMKCGECIKVCPGLEMIYKFPKNSIGVIESLKESWGSVLEVWEGYASNPEIRHNGSSGGIVSALALYCIEKENMYGVLHIGADDHAPIKNKTVLSKTKNDILLRTGSRYSPASPCDELGKIESAPNPCVFVGKPCDIAGLRRAQELKPELNRKVGIAIGIFCAGTPSTRGTIELLKKLNLNEENIAELRYRGKGWPGMTTIRLMNKKAPSHALSYKESWGFVQKYRPYRCYLCPDGTSEFADLSCGDPWYRQINEGDEGFSIVLVRTERGREILINAMRSGYITLKPAKPLILINSQNGMRLKRGAIGGRILTFRLLGIPVPRLKGFYLFRNWLQLSMNQKMRSILGTLRRIMKRKYYFSLLNNSKNSQTLKNRIP